MGRSFVKKIYDMYYRFLLKIIFQYQLEINTKKKPMEYGKIIIVVY